MSDSAQFWVGRIINVDRSTSQNFKLSVFPAYLLHWWNTIFFKQNFNSFPKSDDQGAV